MRAIRSQKPGTVTGGGPEQEGGPYAQRPEGELGALRVGGRRQQLESIQVPEARYDGSQSSSPSPQQRGAAGRSGGLEEREAELEGLIAEYEEAVEGLNQDREVLQQEVQRVLQLERQREEELSHAVSVNQALNEEIAELRESITKGGETSAQKTLLRQLESQVEALQYERDKALLEVDSLYAEVQTLQSRSPTRSGSPPKSPPKKRIDPEAYAQLEQEVLEISKDLEHGYRVMEALRDEGDEFSTQVRTELRGISKEKDQITRAVEDVNGKLRYLLPDSWTGDGGESDEVLLRRVADLERQLKDARRDSAALDSALQQVQETDTKLQEALQACAHLESELGDSRRSAAEDSGVSRISGGDGSDASDGAAAACDRMRHQIDELLDELEDFKKEVDEKNKELEAAHAREEGTAEERARLASRVADLESTLAKEREELVAIRGEMEELQAAEAEREKDKGAAANVEDVEALQEALMDMKMKVEQAAEKDGNREAEYERDVATLEARLEDEVAQREAAQRALAKMMDSEEEEGENWKERLEELQRKLASSRELEEAQMGTIKGLNDRVRELEEEAEAARREAGETRARAAELERAAEEAERQAADQLESTANHCDELKVKVGALTREVEAAESRTDELRRAAKGTLGISEAKHLTHQLEAAHRELEELREARATGASDTLNAVQLELDSLVRELSEAKHKQQSFIREETEARQMLERHVRRSLADLQSMASSLQKEAESLASLQSPISSPSSQRPGFRQNFTASKADTSLEDRVRDLEIRNRQLEQQARLLMTANRELDILEKDRIVREAEQVWAESESRLWSTLQDQEEQFRQLQQRKTQGSAKQSDGDGHKYNRLRSRVEDLEARLLGSVRELEADRGKGGGGGGLMQQQMGELVAAQREVQEALRALTTAQTGLQEQQRQLTSRQEKEQREVTAQALPPAHPLSVLTPWSSSPPHHLYHTPSPTHHPLTAPPAHFPPYTDARPLLAYMDLATPPPAPYGTYSPAHYGNAWPPSAPAEAVSAPGSGISFATLNKFAPPSWRAAFGIAPVEVRTEPPQTFWSPAGRPPSSAYATPQLSARSQVSDRSALHDASQPSAAKQLIDATMKKISAAAEVSTVSPPNEPGVASAPSSAYLSGSYATPSPTEGNYVDSTQGGE